MKKAFHMKSGRLGPVVVDVPKDSQRHRKNAHFSTQKPSLRSYTPALKGHTGQIRKALDLLLEAKRPVIYAGGGVVIGDAAEGDHALQTARISNDEYSDGSRGISVRRPVCWNAWNAASMKQTKQCTRQ